MKLATLFALFLCFSLGACSEAGVEEVTPALLTIGNVQYSEGNAENELVFTVTLVGDNPGGISVNYRTEDGTARAGEDYEGVSSGQVTFGPTDTRQRISITLLDDFAFEPDESFSIILFNPVNAELLKDQALGTILNDDSQIDFQIPSTGYRTPASYPNMTQVWADEFQASSLNLDDWTHQLGNGCPNLCGWGNNELQYYQPENTFMAKNEYLVIEAREERVDGFSYTSSRIITQGKQSLKFGRVDIRAVLPIGQGLWPALWMLGDNIDQVSWPRCGEIDIMEIRGDQPATLHGTAHWFNDTEARHNFRGNTRTLNSGNFSEQFHVFSIIWDSQKIVWLLDDVPYYEMDITAADLTEFQNSFFFLFNVAVGGNFSGNPDGTASFPQRMIVDYIRVFQ